MTSQGKGELYGNFTELLTVFPMLKLYIYIIFIGLHGLGTQGSTHLNKEEETRLKICGKGVPFDQG